MRFSRARYVTLCQQSLVTAAVLAVGLSAAGVKTLDIVPQPGTAAGAREGVSGTAPNSGPGSANQALAGGAEDHQKSEVDTAPVTPKVREVAVTSAPPRAAARQAQPKTQPDQTSAPRSQAPEPKSGEPAKRGFVESTPQKVHGYATVGVTWKHGVSYAGGQLAITVRTKLNGVWSEWRALGHDEEDGPDANSPEVENPQGRPGTDALVIGDVDQVQMRAQTTDGSVPPDLKLAIIDPGSGKMTKQAPAIDTSKLPSPKGAAATDANGPQASGQTTLEGDGVQDDVSLSAMVRSAKPYIYSRAQWGANERMREQSAPQYGTVRTGFIHHTVNANNYTSAQVPALLRGIYAYHTQSRGWRDIGYNYLVDRFGRIWEGRWGGVDRAVVGAHTLGYNEVSFAMSAIGNYDIARPPQAVLNAFARLFAWKLSIYNIPANTTRIAVKGRYLQAINGHRDVGQTACPGRYLYAQIPWIRKQARAIQVAAQKGGGGTTTPPPPPPPPVFTSPTQTARPAVAQPRTIKFPRAVNLAGSAYPDLVMMDSQGRTRVLSTGGQTSYRTVVSTPGSWGSMSMIAAAGDLSGDGKGDVLGRIAGVTRVYRGNGAGHVATTGVAPTRAFQYANKVVAAGDFNGLGRNDMLMRHRTNGGLYLVPGIGRSAFAKPRLLSRGWAGFSAIAVPGDLTGDGRPDVVGLKNGVLYVYPNVRGSRLGAAVQKQSVGSSYNAILGSGRDVNGDGVGDLLVRARSTGQLGVRLGQSKSTFGNTLGWFNGPRSWKMLSSAQMAGTRQADLVGIGPMGKQLLVLANNGLPNVQDLVTTNLTVPGATMMLNAGDWNGDGKGDIIRRDNGRDRLVLQPGLGGGKYGAGILMSNGWKGFVNLAAVGDVTGDRRPDLMGRVNGGPMTIFPSAGGAKFQAPILAPASMRTFNQIGAGSWRPGSMPTSSVYSFGAMFVPYVGSRGKMPSPYNRVVGPGDVDGDGRPDLVARDGAGDLWVLPGTTTGYGNRRYLASGFGQFSFIG